MSSKRGNRFAAVLASALLLLPAPRAADAQNVRGFVFGEESGAPMEGVFVRLLSRTLDPIDTTRTDLLGRFSFQAGGPQRYVVVAEKDGYAAAPQIIEVSAIALATVGVTIAMAPMGTTSEDEDALGDERVAHVRGRVVVAGTDDGIENAEVTDVVTGRSVLTRFDGRFVLGDVRPGPVRMRIEHLAYTSREWAVDTEPGSAYDALIPLEAEAIPLEGIEVTVRSRAVARKLEPVFERMARNLGGIFISATDLKKRGYGQLGHAIQGLPSVSVVGSGFRSTLRFRRGATLGQPGCAPELWLDGVRVARAGEPLSEFLEMNTIEVEVIELFPSASSIPAEYSTSALCAVGIWTKRGG